MLQPKKNKTSWESEKEWLQNWYSNRILPDPELNKTYQKEKKQYIKQSKKLPTPNFLDEIDKDNTQGLYHKDTGAIDILSSAEPLVYTHEGAHAINIPLKDTESSMTAFLEIGKNILPQEQIQDEWVKKNYPEISNYHEISSRLNSYRQLHGLQPDQEITPEIIKANRSSYNKGDIPFETNTDQLYKMFEDEGLSNVLNKVVVNDNNQEDTTIAAYGTGKNGTKMRKKKYALGSPGIEDPATTLAKNNIMIAQADQKAENNPWIPITMLAGQLASTALSSGIMSSGKKVAPQKVDSVSSLNSAGLAPLQGATFGQSQFINALGNTNASGEVEVEGNEVLELPTGQVAEVKGDSHENGGVDMNLPEGTKIYSKRIQKFGETMAERKKIRERKKLNLDKLLEDNKNDIAVRNAHKRTMETLEAQEAEDLKTQEMFGMMAAIHEYAYGTGKNGVPKYADGTGIYGTYTPKTGYDPVTGRFIKPSIEDQYVNPISFASDAPTNLDYLNLGPTDSPEGTLTMAQLEADNPKENLPGTVFSRTADKVGSAIVNSGIKVPATGDVVGLFGDLYSAFAPMKNTLAARAGDTPNVNQYKDFGKDALEANLSAMELAAGQRDANLRRVSAQAAGAKRAGRNTARGVNQARALDLATDINVNEAALTAGDSYTRTMMDLFGQKAGLENVQDQAVMAGEAAADLANRQDKDNFYTQLSKDIATKGQGIQMVGKDLNARKQNEMMTNLVNQLSKYFDIDDKGNLTQKPQTK